MDQKRTLKLKKELDQLKTSMNEWVLFLNYQQRDSKNQIRQLEGRIKELELEKDIRGKNIR